MLAMPLCWPEAVFTDSLPPRLRTEQNSISVTFLLRMLYRNCYKLATFYLAIYHVPLRFVTRFYTNIWWWWWWWLLRLKLEAETLRLRHWVDELISTRQASPLIAGLQRYYSICIRIVTRPNTKSWEFLRCLYYPEYDRE